MAWTPVVEVKAGDFVGTPFGGGEVRAVSDNGIAQVKVKGQLFDVPLGDITPEGAIPNKPEGGQPVPVRSWRVKPGDRVQGRSNGRKGTVSEVTQRTVRVKYDNNKTGAYIKKEIHKHFDEVQDDQPNQPQPEKDNSPLKVGDRVKSKVDDGSWIKSGMTGTVAKTENGGGSITVKFDDAKGQGHDGAMPGYRGSDMWHMSEKQLEKINEEEEKKEEPQPKQEQDPVTKTGDGLHELMRLKEYLESKIDEDVDAELAALREAIKQKQTLEVKVGDKVNEVKGLRHKQLDQLIKYAALRLSPLLVGMAGTGKTHAGEQTANALGLDFYAMSVGAQTSKSDIIGYMAANGQYVKTHFRDAYEKGGVFLMDEIDAGNANVLIQINAALSNDLCSFPDAMIRRHPDFVFIASANTFGNGASRQYVGRNQLDAATLDRFAVIEWFIDDELESNLTTGINGKAWYMAVRAARDYVAEKNIRALVSPRATQKGSRLLHIGQDLREVIHATMLGSVPEDKKADVERVATTIFEKFASEVPSELPKQVNPEVSDLIRS